MLEARKANKSIIYKSQHLIKNIKLLNASNPSKNFQQSFQNRTKSPQQIQFFNNSKTTKSKLSKNNLLRESQKTFKTNYFEIFDSRGTKTSGSGFENFLFKRITFLQSEHKK